MLNDDLDLSWLHERSAHGEGVPGQLKASNNDGLGILHRILFSKAFENSFRWQMFMADCLIELDQPVQDCLFHIKIVLLLN